MATKREISSTPSQQKSFYVKVTDEEQSDDAIELPVESDGTVALSTISAQFPGASGLKYRNMESGTFRGLRLDDHSRVHPPNEGWGDLTFIVVFPKENTKRKIDNDHVDSNAAASKQKRVERKKCSDLIVLGLPYKTTEDELREYFEQFGEVLVSQVKRDPQTEKSKGFGFVRFAEYDSQLKVLSQRHNIDGRWCDVKIPNSKVESQNTGNRKIFIGRLSESITAEDLREFFSKFGEIIDIFIPKPFRGFAFVTFSDPEIAQSLCGEDYVIRQCSVHVSPAAPKESSSVTGPGHRNSRPYTAVGPTSTSGSYSNRPLSPLADRRSDYYYPSGQVSPQARMNRHQVWSSFPSNSMPSGNTPSYGNPWSLGTETSTSHHVQMAADPMGLITAPSNGRSMTPMPPSQPPPPPPSGAVVLPTSVNSQSAAASATNQATVGMGALNLGSFNIGNLLNPALFAAAQAAILQTLAQTTQSLQGGPSAADISSALLGNMPSVAQMATHGGPQPPPPPGTGSVSCAPTAWWPTHTTSVVAVPSSAVPPSAGVMTTTMSGEMVASANGAQSGRVWEAPLRPKDDVAVIANTTLGKD